MYCDQGSQFDGQRIMFWKEERRDVFDHPVAKLAAAVGDLLFPDHGLDPQECVRADIPRNIRELAAKILAAGKIGMSYMGYADCRICGDTLGVSDLYGFGFMWPAKAEHYVLEHDVWVPGLDHLIAAWRAQGGK